MTAITAWALLLTISATLGQEAEVVNTTLGPVKGLRQTVLGKDVDVYYGIPFAKPPVGDLRFKRPQPAQPWTGIRNATTKPNACFQSIDMAFDRFPGVEMWNPNTPMSEDCLYLSVWVPRGSGSQPKTTMVWIYGGGFYSGSSMLDVYDGSKLAVSQNVIVASVNYRVGTLGFLYTGTSDAPGNQGLVDQALALEWVYDNVVNFGGQQDNITIFGESAGSFSVGLHLMSPLSMNYFTRAIMQSGAPAADWVLLTKPELIARAKKLSAMFSCPEDSISDMMRCLRQADAQNVTDAQWGLISGNFYIEIPLSAVVDDYFLTEDPRVLLARGPIKDTQLLVGITKDEASYFLLYSFPGLFPFNDSYVISDEDFKTLVHALTFNGGEAVDKAVMYQYMDRLLPGNRPSHRDAAIDISGEDLFICPTVNYATAFASLNGNRDVYLYSFEHRLSSNPWPEWAGVMHGYEIEAVFGLPLEYNYTQGEEALSGRMMGYWTRFAQNGNPNNGSDIIWPKLSSPAGSYLKLTAEGDRAELGLRYEQCAFRSTILPMLREDPTTQPCEQPTGGQGTAAPFLPLLVFSAFCLGDFTLLLP